MTDCDLQLHVLNIVILSDFFLRDRQKNDYKIFQKLIFKMTKIAGSTAKILHINITYNNMVKGKT